MTAENHAPAATLDLKRTSPTRRDLVLAKVLDPDRLPTPPAVALQVVNAASRPDCKPADLVVLLGRDPALCGKLLKAVNSCIYGLGKPVATIDRAIVLLGLATVRSLALGLSLPAMRPSAGPDPRTKEYWMESVGGAIIARELAARCRLGNPEDALVAGLLRDLGSILLAQAYPQRWAALAEENPDGRLDDPVANEAEVFGIDHAEVSAELLLTWNLPRDVIEPVRHHHSPDRLAGAARAVADRARVLHLASQLVHLDAVVRNPAWLGRVLDQAREFGLSRSELIAFLGAVVPKIEEFVRLVNQEITVTPEFTGVLTRGTGELVNLTVETNRTRLSGTIAVSGTRRVGPGTNTPAPSAARALSVRPGAAFAAEAAPDLGPGGRLGDHEIRAQLGLGARQGDRPPRHQA
ncbi:HDOD domain-containing protein, partial [bacterium]|nr:HDOD domain-containing protein [bacterium]